MDGNRRTEDMVPHWQLLGMYTKGCGERGVVLFFRMERTARYVLNRFAVVQDVPGRKAFVDIITFAAFEERPNCREAESR